MKKITAALALAIAIPLSFAGCSKLGSSSGFHPAENCVYIQKDGGVQWASVETYEQGSYTEEEMLAFAKEKISAYNNSLGKGTESENKEGAEKLPVALVSGQLGDGKALLVTEFDTPSRLLEFAQEIGDHNVTFTALEMGRVATMSKGFAETSFADVKGNGIETQTVTGDGERFAVKAEGKGLVRTEEKVLYVSEGCTVKDENTVETSQEGTSYIILN